MGVYERATGATELWSRFLIAGSALGAVALLSACGGGHPQQAKLAPRPTGLRYVHTTGWYEEPNQLLEQDPGIGIAKAPGDPKIKSNAPPSEWDTAAVLGVPSKDVPDKATMGRLVLTYIDPGGHLHMGILPAGIKPYRGANNTDEYAALEGPGYTSFQLVDAHQTPNGVTTFTDLPTKLEGVESLPELAKTGSGMSIVADSAAQERAAEEHQKAA